MAAVVQRIVDPRERAAPGVLVERVELPMRGPESGASAEGEGRHVVTESEQMREVVVRALFPSGRPDHLEVLAEPRESWANAIGDAVRDAVDEQELAWNLIQRAVEAEQADDAVDVNSEYRLG